MNHKDLRTDESDWRTAPQHPYAAPKPPKRSSFTLHHVLIAVLFIMAGVAVGTARAAPGDALEVRMVLSDHSWHGVGGDVQIQASTVDPILPNVRVWQREPVQVPAGVDPYGHWFYVNIIYSCVDRAFVVFGMLDDFDEFKRAHEVLGYRPDAVFPRPGSPDYRTMQAVCALYGYQL